MKKEIIPIASDHPAFELKKELILFISKLGFEPLDLGTYSKTRVDYPTYCLSVADKVSKGEYERGIVICKTGVGASIVANKFPNIRAGLVRTVEVAKLTRQHNDTNILALGSGFTSEDKAKKITKTWLFTEYEGGRHQRRIDQISTIESQMIAGKSIGDNNNLLSSSILNETLNKSVKITASLMCANQLNILHDVNELIAAGIDQFHIDIIDGSFAPNVSMNVEHIEALRTHTDHLIDVHLMVKDPTPYLPRIADAGANIAIIHVEGDYDINKALDDIKSHNMKVGIAVEVRTPLEKIYPYLDKIDMVMFMTVNCGFKGTQYIPEVQDKIATFDKYRAAQNLPISIMVDGSLGPRTIPHLFKSGARIFVGGTSGLFKPGSFEENIKQMKSYCL